MRIRRAVRRWRQAGLVGMLLLLRWTAVDAQTISEQTELDFGRLSLAVGSGARALGMGGAFLARPDDATAASWNPAGLSYLRFSEVSLVGISYTQDTSQRDEAGALQRLEHTRGTLPDFLAVAVPVAVGATSGAVQVSYQRVIPYTGRRRIDQSIPSRPQAFEVEATGGFDVLAASTGLKLSPWLRAGVSVNRWLNGFSQDRRRLLARPSDQEAELRLSGWSLNAGLIVHPHESLNVGVVAKTRMRGTVTLERRRTDTFSNSPGPEVVTHNAYRANDVRLDLPGAVGFGASWRASSVLTLSSDYTVTFWSRSRIRNFFTLAAAPDNTAAPPSPTVYPKLPYPNVNSNVGQSDTRELRVGIEYVLIAGRLKLPLRAGYVREKQYRVQPDGTSPRLDGVTGGAGLILGPLLIDAAYVHQWGGFGPPAARESLSLNRALLSLIYRHGSDN